MLPVFHPSTGRPFSPLHSRQTSWRNKILGRVFGRNFLLYLTGIVLAGFLLILVLSTRSVEIKSPVAQPGASSSPPQQAARLDQEEHYNQQTEEIKDNAQPRPPVAATTSLNDDNRVVTRPDIIVRDSPNETEDNRNRRNAVRKAFMHAYEGYEKACFGQDELKALTNKCQNWLNQGLTIVDSLDTMLIMGMVDHFKRARDWISSNLDFDRDVDVSLFETNIRVLGGLEVAYDFTADKMFLDKAVDLADRLLKAFKPAAGLPHAMVNLKTGKSHMMSWTGGSAVLAEVGTIQMEFSFLSKYSGNPIYHDKALAIFKKLRDHRPPNGLYPIYVNADNGQFSRDTVSLGALGDSFYEYLVKTWLLTDKKEAWLGEMYFDAAESVLKHMEQTTSPTGLKYIGELNGGHVVKKVDHLACFAAGMYALGAHHTSDKTMAARHMEFAKGFAQFCYNMYSRMPTKLAADAVTVNDNNDFNAAGSRYFILRPETVESLFYLWRFTNDTKYRDWGWDIFQAIEKHCKTEYGYVGIRDVMSDNPVKDDLQQSWFLAETLKYLFLLFSPHEYIPLDKYVFNTEAHPFHVFDVNT